MKKSLGKKLGLAAVPLLIFLLPLEIGLRSFPQAIPLEVLIRFEPGLRSQLGATSSVGRAPSRCLGTTAGAALHLANKAEKREIEFSYAIEFPDAVSLEFNSRNGDRDEVQFARRLREGQECRG